MPSLRIRNTPCPKIIQECRCERYSCDEPSTARFYLWSPRHFVNLDITHGRLRLLMCHNSLWSVVCGRSPKKQSPGRLWGWKDRTLVFPFLRREMFGRVLVFCLSLGLRDCHSAHVSAESVGGCSEYSRVRWDHCDYTVRANKLAGKFSCSFPCVFSLECKVSLSVVFERYARMSSAQAACHWARRWSIKSKKQTPTSE